MKQILSFRVCKCSLIYCLFILHVPFLALCKESISEKKEVELVSIGLRSSNVLSDFKDLPDSGDFAEEEVILAPELADLELIDEQPLFIFNKELKFAEFPKSFNPSLMQCDLGLILTFRYYPDPLRAWISSIGIVILDDQLNPISQPQLIDTRSLYHFTDSQSEDARIFSFLGDLYLTYNDNLEITNPNNLERRDIFIAPLSYVNEEFKIGKPLKLYHQKDYFTRTWQKNWIPFEWNNHLLISYTLNPHEVIYPNLITGECIPIYKTKIPPFWIFGEMRGGTPALLVDGEYLSFFHSSVVMESTISNKKAMHHYFMGAYTFSAEPPFNITKITFAPLLDKNFYTESDYDKRVIFPGGFALIDQYIYVAYGKDDQEIWISKIDKNRLYSMLTPIDKN